MTINDKTLRNSIRNVIDNESKQTLTTKTLIEQHDKATGISSAIAFIVLGLMTIIASIVYVVVVSRVQPCDSFDDFVPLLLGVVLGAVCIISACSSAKRTKDAISDFESGNFVIYEKIVTDKQMTNGSGSGHRRFLISCGEETIRVSMKAYYNVIIGDEHYVIVRCTKKRNFDTQLYAKKEYKIPEDWVCKIQ